MTPILDNFDRSIRRIMIASVILGALNLLGIVVVLILAWTMGHPAGGS